MICAQAQLPTTYYFRLNVFRAFYKNSYHCEMSLVKSRSSCCTSGIFMKIIHLNDFLHVFFCVALKKHGMAGAHKLWAPWQG